MPPPERSHWYGLGPMASELATMRTSRRSLPNTLRVLRAGGQDPTTWLAPGRFVRATFTPDGPGTVCIRWRGAHDDTVDADAWGPGATWLLDRVDAMTGERDAVPPPPDHPIVGRAFRNNSDLRLAASCDLYHELLPTIIQQRITMGEALRQWRFLCHALGAAAPGPFSRLLLPPSPASLWRRPGWWFHPLGIERSRARALVEAARVADRLWDWAAAGSSHCGRLLVLLPGVGPWTVGSVLGAALGDPDAVPVGDYHIPNMVAWALAGEPRADDARMLELLEPFAGQRGRVIRLLAADGHHAPAFGPRQRVLPMHRW